MASTALPPADLLPVGREANIPYRILRLVAVPLLKLCFRFQVEGRENIPRTGNYIVIANHLNWLDEFAILMLFPVEPRLHFLADPTGLVKRKFQWWIIRTTGGYVPVVRERHGDATLYHHVDRCLEVGGAVAIFPEGNYGPTEGEMLPFKKGFAHFATENHVPVLPIALSGTQDLWLRKPVRLIVGEPIESDGQTVDSLVTLAETRMRALLPPYHDPGGAKLFRRRLTHLF
jgi:1-acyl-sn-glycerol-3-phosphate acyltransferase